MYLYMNEMKDYEKSMQIGHAVRSTPGAERAADARGKPGHMFEDTYDERSKNNYT